MENNKIMLSFITRKRHLIIELIMLLIIFFLVFSRNVDLQNAVDNSIFQISYTLDHGLIIVDPISGDVISQSKSKANGSPVEIVAPATFVVSKSNNNNDYGIKPTSLIDKIISPAYATNPRHVYKNVYITTSEGTSCVKVDKFYHPPKPVGPCT